MSERYNNLDAMMERYKQEMLRYYASRRTETEAETAVPEEREPARVRQEAEQPGEQAPPTVLMPSPGSSEREPGAGLNDTAWDESGPEAPAELDDVGYIRVEVFTGREAVPLSDADVAIAREDPNDAKGRMELVRFAVTDASGWTASCGVPTVSRSLSETPGNPHPFATYYVRAWARGYELVSKRPVDVFGGETSEVPLEMIPIPEAPAVPLPMREGE